MAAHGLVADPDQDALTNSSHLVTSGADPSSAAASLPSPTSPSWRHIFRLGSAGGRKPNRSKSTLTLDTEFAAAAGSNDLVSAPGAYGQAQGRKKSSAGDGDVSVAVMPSALTPSSSVSFNRYSSYSTGTASSGDSGLGAPYTSQSSGSRQYAPQGPAVVNGHSVPPSSSTASTARGQGWPQSQPNTPDVSSQFQSMNQSATGLLPTPSSSAGQERVKSKASHKSEKRRTNGQHAPLLTPVTDAPPSPGLTSPKAPSRSGMTKFIRRVASAPNAKGFFTLSRSNRDRESNAQNGSRTPTSMKGFGFLSPTLSSGGRNDTVPEVPPVPSNGASHRISEQGTDSLETASSGSSHGRVLYSGQQRLSHGPQTTPPPAYQAPHIATTLSHSQSAQNLLSPSHGSLLSPTKGARPSRANSSASFTGPLKGLKGKTKEPVSRIGLLSAPPVPVGSGSDGTGRAPFRRTYSSNSIKIRSVEVGPGSFQKVKLLGRGDVGKVYLVREKKSGKLFAMKGLFH